MEKSASNLENYEGNYTTFCKTEAEALKFCEFLYSIGRTNAKITVERLDDHNLIVWCDSEYNAEEELNRANDYVLSRESRQIKK